MSVLQVEQLRVRVEESVGEMAQAAATDAAMRMRRLLSERGSIRAVFAAAASQEAFLDALLREPDLDWGRVEVLQLDEYVGLAASDPRSLRHWLETHLTGRVPIGRAEYMDGAASDLRAECDRYAAVVLERPIDLGFIGVGENGHLAFNDPHAADFDDPAAVKVVEIDETSRSQQVRDGAFPDLASVPSTALTLTMSAILGAGTLSVVVPGAHKAAAIAEALSGPVSSLCPASALRRHADAVLYVDRAAFANVHEQVELAN